MRQQLLVAALSTLIAPLAAGEDRFRLAADFGWAARDLSVQSVSTYPEFFETTSVTGTQPVESSSVLAGEAQFRFLRNLGVAVAFQSSSRKGDVAIVASVPHPLYFNRPREVTASEEADYEESALHVDLVAMTRRGRLALRAFAGASFFSAKAELIQRASYQHSFPFDTATFTAAMRTPADGSATGFNLGAGVDFTLVKHVALGVQARFSRATVELAPTSTTGDLGPVEVDAGGLTAGGGLRITF